MITVVFYRLSRSSEHKQICDSLQLQTLIENALLKVNRLSRLLRKHIPILRFELQFLRGAVKSAIILNIVSFRSEIVVLEGN